MHGAFFLPCSNRSRTRDAPTPTNISTKSEPLIEKNGTFASPATARASSVFPVPGEPMSSTPLGMRPPSFWNFCGSFRNSMISCSSSFASSTPETSLKVTFFCELDDSFARLLPNERALFPPLCICRMMKIQKPIISRIGRPRIEHRRPHARRLGLDLDRDALFIQQVRRASRTRAWRRCGICSVPFPLVEFNVPTISFPVIVTSTISVGVALRCVRNVENAIVVSDFPVRFVENVQIRTPTTTRTIQNSKLLRVEFNLGLLTALLSRVSRLVTAP